VKDTGRRQDWHGASFGSLLKAGREKKGLSLSDVSLATRITCSTLLLLEKEDWEHLPPPAFVRGFVKAYAEAVGVDAAKALSFYQTALEKAMPQTRRGIQAATAAAWMFQLGVLAAFTLLVTALVVMICLPGGETERDPVVPGGIPPARIGAGSEKTPESVLHLKITAVSDTWVRAMADGVEVRRFDLNAGQTVNLTARREFNLLVGSPSAIRLSLDGKPVPVAARAGQAVNVKLP